MIYIDPPYNTGNDFVYKDNFSKDTQDELLDSGQKDEYNQKLIVNPETAGRYHSDWLTMMYPRLKLARNLLTDDGVILISIDNNEIENLTKILSEIFGEKNHIETIVWKKKYGGGAKTRFYVGLHEYIVVFAKNIDSIDSINIPYEQETIDKYYKYKDEYCETRGPYRLQPLSTNSNDFRPNLRYPLMYKGKEVWPEKQWQWSKTRTDEALKNNEIVFMESKDKISVNFKQYLKDADGEMRESKPTSIIEGIYTQHGTNEIKEIFGDGQIFSFPKPSNLISLISTAYLKENDIFIDFFSGSSSSAHAILNMNSNDSLKRKFINVQVPEITNFESEAYKAGFKNICEIGKERIRRAAKKIKDDKLQKVKKEGIFADFNDTQDYGFRVYRLDESNMQEVYYKPQDYNQSNLELFADNIKPGRTSEDLLAQIILDWGLPLNLKIETMEINGKQVYKVASNSLYACFSSNIDEEFAKEVAKEKPLRIVFKDAGFKDDTAKTNVKQLLKQISPQTEMKVI